MEYYKCIRDYYLADMKFASVGDVIAALRNSNKVCNKTKNLIVNQMPEILNDTRHFTKLPAKEDIISEDKVNHPSHYTWLKDKCGIEVIDITRHLDFCLGNAIKYLLRAGYKTENGYSDNQKEIEDLEKAIWYIKDKINHLK